MEAMTRRRNRFCSAEGRDSSHLRRGESTRRNTAGNGNFTGWHFSETHGMAAASNLGGVFFFKTKEHSIRVYYKRIKISECS